MRGMRGTGQGGAAPPESAALSAAPARVGQGGPRREKGEVVSQAPGPHSGEVRPATEILPRIDAALAERQGVRVGWIGNTGCGKTFGMAWLLGHIVAEDLIDVVLINDDKNRAPPWVGHRRATPSSAAANPPGEDDEGPDVVVYRGVAMDPNTPVDIEDVAAQAWELVGMEGHPTVAFACDELRRAVSPAGREWRAPTVARAITEGRAAGLSVIWGTQSPQRIPVEAFDNSLLCVFQLGHRGRAYLERSDLISGSVSLVIAGLRPRQFLVVDDAGDWDGKIYEVPILRRRPQPEPGLLGPAEDDTSDGE